MKHSSWFMVVIILLQVWPSKEAAGAIAMAILNPLLNMVKFQIKQALGNLTCPNTTDGKDVELMMNLEAAGKSIGFALQVAPTIGGKANEYLQKDIVAEISRCKQTLMRLKKARMQEEMKQQMNETYSLISTMDNTIRKGFAELNTHYDAMQKQIERGNDKMRAVEDLVGEEKYSEFKLKLDLLMEKLQETLDNGTMAQTQEFVNMCNHIDNSDKMLVMELGMIISIDETTYVGAQLKKTQYKDEKFIEAFGIIDLLLPNLRKYRLTCFLAQQDLRNITNWDDINKKLSRNVKSQINQVYGKVKSLKKQRENMYFNSANIFKSFGCEDTNDAHCLKNAQRMPRGYDSELNKHYVYFDCRNYTVYEKYRYSIEFFNNKSLQDEPKFNVSYDPMYVSLVKVRLPTQNETIRTSMFVVRTRINHDFEDFGGVPDKHLEEVGNGYTYDTNPDQLMEKFRCKLGVYRLVSVYITPVFGGMEYSYYGFGHCYSIIEEKRTDRKQLIACFVIADEECSNYDKKRTHGIRTNVEF